MSLASVFLFSFLLSSLNEEDRGAVENRILVLEAICHRKSNVLEEMDDEVRWEGANGDTQDTQMRYLTADGKVLTESPGMGQILPSQVFPPPAPTDGISGYKVVSGSDQKNYYLGTARVTGHDGSKFLIQVARDRSEELGLVEEYKEKITYIMIIWASASALAGSLVANWSGRPLRRMAALAGQVRPQNLSDRIDPAGFPSEVGNLAITFNGMLDRLEDAFGRLARFSADLAHELRTPMAILRGETEVALSQVRSAEEYRAVLESNLEECDRLSRMIEGLLFIARAEHPQHSIERREFSALRALEGICEYYEAYAEEVDITWSFDCDGQVWADPELFRRAISNLLSNAFKYTPFGGTVRLDVHSQEDGTLVVVRDTGVGIKHEELPLVFDRLYRADSSRLNQPGGFGLGLAIVKSIMDLHGGYVKASSECDAGTTVTLFFPPAPDPTV